MKYRHLLVLLFVGMLAGCQTPKIAEYKVSRDSLFLLQQMEPASVSVGEFAGPTSLDAVTSTELFAACSLSADNQSDLPLEPAAFIREALAEELDTAGFYAETGGQAHLTGEISELSLQRGLLFDGAWVLGLRLVSSNGSELRVSREYEFDTGAFLGPTICRRAVERFEPAVRALLEKAIYSPEFRHLLQPQ